MNAENNNKRKIIICGSGGQVGMMAMHIAKIQEEFPDCEIVTDVQASAMGVGGLVKPEIKPKLNESKKLIERQLYTPPPTRAERRAKARKKKRW